MHTIRHSLLLIWFIILGSACSRSEVYPVKAYKYYSDEEVHVFVRTPSNQDKVYICDFAPNTDYQHMKKVRIQWVKSDYKLDGTVYFCQALN